MRTLRIKLYQFDEFSEYIKGIIFRLAYDEWVEAKTDERLIDYVKKFEYTHTGKRFEL